MPNCTILGCKNNTKNIYQNDGNISFHRFPSDPCIKKAWIEATGRKNWQPSTFSRICCVHFDINSFAETIKRRRLTTTAIPTIDIVKTTDQKIETNKQQVTEMSEVDKFKRRVIRAVARLLRKDQTPGEEMWKALQNEAGCDCKLLWQRMCALTMKKMRRLLLAEDRLDSIAAVAKMTLTDWLLFDLVLVHEDIDVIGQDLKMEPAILTELFNVVKRFQIEGKQGEELATAWTGATFYYNSFGRQCSPMLLQRRWYQLKKLARANFYKFWSQYRGNPRLLAIAKESQPTKLHNDIAQRYPHIITTQFMEWDQMIKERWIILPEEFETKLKKRSVEPKQPSTANEPDIVLLEPRIETIDLGVDSDQEPDVADDNSTDSPSQPLNPVSLAAAIKKEPQDEFEMDFEDDFAARVLEATQMPEDESTVENEDDTTTLVETQEDEVADKVQEPIRMPMICSVAGNFDETSVAALIAESERERRAAAIMDDVNNILVSAVEGTSEICKDSVETSTEITANATKVTEEPMQIEEESAAEAQPIEIDESDDSAKGCSNQVMTEINNILETAAEVNTKGVCNVQKVKRKIGPKSRVHRPHEDEMTVESDPQLMDVDESDKGYTGGVMSEINDILKSAMHSKTTHKTPVTNVDATAEDITRDSDKGKQRDLTSENIKTDEIKVRDVKLGETPLEELVNNIKSGIEASAGSEIDPAIDIPTDLTFEDDGIELVDDGIAFEEDNDYEEKPHIKTEIGASTSDETEKLDDSPKFDLKLLMHPCVYTIKLEDMVVFKNKSIDEVKDKITLETASVESKIHVKEEPKEIKDDQDNESIKNEIKSEADNDSSDSDDGIPENKKVKLSSYMLQKPKSRSYNPIQLCKNPDFNTRLKRLTVGFLSSSRNRLLLKCLKPMTIDLSKAFESKLIDGTVYLKSDDGPKIKCEEPEEVTEEPSVTAVMPSAMPVQSLIDNSSVNLQELLPPKPPEPEPAKPHEGERTTDLPERQKTINLPDINNIRRINQHLLTAEVTPMRMQANDNFAPPVQLVSLPSVPTAPTERKKQSRPRYNLSWNSVRPEKCTGKDEFLLTLDALNKMLNLFNETGSAGTAAKQKKSKKSHLKQRMELQKRIDEIEKKEDLPVETGDKGETEAKETKESEDNKKMEESPPDVVTPKIKVLLGKPYGQYCCWARNKIDAPGKKAIRAHQCPRICRCCCRGELAMKYSRPRLVRRITKPSTIIISDDEETKDVSETIEKVVSEVRGRGPDGSSKPKTDISTQCCLDPPPEVGNTDLSTKPAKEHSKSSSGNQPRITVIPGQNPSTSYQRPVRVRKDLLLEQSPTKNVPLVPPKHRAHITIDASQKSVKIHSEPVYINSDGQNKIVYLNGKQKDQLTSPIFLGENKILLTDVKFPGTTPTFRVPRIAPAPVVPVVPAVSAVPTVPAVTCDTPMVLPPGVQVILLTDGQLTYTVDAGVKLTAEELATLPVVLEAIRQQLNANAPVPAASSEVVNLTNEDDAPPLASNPALATGDASDDTTTSVSNNKEPTTIDEQDKRTPNATGDTANATEPKQVDNNDEGQTAKSKDNVINEGLENIQLPAEVTEGTSSSNTENVTDANQIESENAPLPVVTDAPLVQTNTVATGAGEAGQDAAESNNVPQNISENTNESTNSTDQSNRKTLLSDLMEMSGISEEDIRTNVPVINDNTVQGMVPAVPVVNVATADMVAPQASAADPDVIITGGTMPNIPELTPITSFSQLKYACEHNGRFFKLDLQLGTLSKIAVCIKKNKPPKLAPLMVKSVVDLTEEQDDDKQVEKDVLLDEARIPAHKIKTNQNVITLNEEVLPSSTIKTNRSLLKANQQQTPGPDQVKPLKLFRAIRILKKNKTQDSPTKLQVSNLGPGLPESVTVHVKQKRKQELSQANIRDSPSMSLPVVSGESARDETETIEEIDESSLDSAELDQYIWKDTEEYLSDFDTGTEYLDSDTSDDEPLANKAKRMRVNEAELGVARSEINKEAVVAKPDQQTGCELQEINIQPSSQLGTVQDTQKESDVAMEVDNTAAAAVITENSSAEGDVMEEANIEDANMTEEVVDPETELTGEDEGQFEDELNLVPALQVVEGMEEDGDDEDCILGF